MKTLSGCRVLVVEDEVLVSMLLEDALREAGATVIGPATHIETARFLLRRDTPSAAILDIGIAGDLVYPLANELASRSVPFVFITGYLEYPAYRPWSDIPVFTKPFSVEAVVAAVARIARRHDPQA